jgi:hypothetical protein
VEEEEEEEANSQSVTRHITIWSVSIETSELETENQSPKHFAFIFIFFTQRMKGILVVSARCEPLLSWHRLRALPPKSGISVPRRDPTREVEKGKFPKTFFWPARFRLSNLNSLNIIWSRKERAEKSVAIARNKCFFISLRLWSFPFPFFGTVHG